MLRLRLAILATLVLFRIIPNNASAQPLEIWEIQGSGAASPYLGQAITTEGNIVTARGNGFFFIQTPDERADEDPLTSEGLLIADAYFGSVGDVVNISGLVEEQDGMTVLSGPGLSITPTGQSMNLPVPAVFTGQFPSEVPGPVHSLERVEGMRVTFSALANGPSGFFETVPLRMEQERVMREPGIEFPGLPGLPVWDGNPELFWIDPNGLNAPNDRFITSNSQVTATGVLLQGDTDFWLVLPDSYSVEPAAEAEPVRPKDSDEVTVGSLNLLLLFEDEPDFINRARKLARYVTQQMRLPDILAVQEAGSLGALNELAYQIELINPEVNYDTYLLPTDKSLKTGYLVQDFVQNVTVAQLGASEVLTFSNGLLHDRPPLLLQGTLPTVPPTPIQVLNLHLRSLIGIESPTDAAFVRNKRHQQSISVANMVEALRQNGNLVVLGDFNAFPFTDGYVDVFNQISGEPSLGALLEPLSIIAPPIQNELESLPPEQRYSYVFQGSAQALDHCLTANLQSLTSNGMEYARGNADYPLAYEDNTNLPWRASDHDGLVLYLKMENLVANTQLSVPSRIVIRAPNPIRAGQSIAISSQMTALRQARITDLTGRVLAYYRLHGDRSTIDWPSLPAGLYLLSVNGEKGVRQIKIISQ